MKEYHPQLKQILDKWLEFDGEWTQRHMNFILHIAVLHEDKSLVRRMVERGADLHSSPESWYAGFLNNYIKRV